ncbi:putative cadmium/zinc-transporting ATPase 3 [Hordeum vulgare]|nr:putative cadmium/zinc-transporting ATPase 3 [Hordeum vulgare]
MAEADDPVAFSAAAAAGGLTHVVVAAAANSPSVATFMLPPPAHQPGFVPPRLVATAPAVPTKVAKTPHKRAANRGRNPTESAARPTKTSKAATAARADDSQPRPAASSSSQGVVPPPLSPPPPTMEEDVATPMATASNMFDDMSQSLDDEGFLHATNVANDDYVSHEYVLQEYVTQYDDDNLDMDDEGFVAKGRSGNYSNAEDVLICTAWKKVSQDASVGSDQPVNTYGQRIKDYFDERNTNDLNDEEKWKTRETFDASKKKSVVTEDEEDVTGEERRPTPYSMTKSYRPDGNKKVKGTKTGDNDLKEGFDAIVMARKEYVEEKRMLKLKEIEERSEAERRRAAAEEKRVVAEERLAAAEERKVELEDKKFTIEDMKMVKEKALKYMFMDTSTLDSIWQRGRG